MNDSSSKSTGLIESCDNMKSTSHRKVKSLSDITEVFQRNSYTGNESNIRRVSLLNVTSEQYGNSERDAFPLRTIGFKRDNQRENHFSGTRAFVDIYSINEEDTEKENGFQKLNVPEMNTNNQIDSNIKSDPIEAIQVSDTPPEEKHLNAAEIKLRKVKRIVLVIDALLASVIITPMTVGFWRGIWSLMDMYADIFPGVITFVLGILVHTIFAISKNLLHTRIIDASRKKACLNKTLWKSTQILYTYVFGAACNMQWRGGWIIFDHFFLDRTWKIITATSVAVITLAIFRSARNLISIPFVVAVDKLTYVFRFPTRYRMNEIVANVPRGNAQPSDGNIN